MNRDYWQLKAAAANYQDAHHNTTRISNRLKALEERGLYDPALDSQLQTAAVSRDESAKILRKLYKAVAPPAIVKFQIESVGLGDLLMAQLVGVVGDFKLYTEAWWETTAEAVETGATVLAHNHDDETGPEKRVLVIGETKTCGVREIWSYCGHGDVTRKRKRGADQATQFAAGSPLAKTLVHEMADFALRQNGVPDKNGKARPKCPYYDHYLARKALTTEQRPDWTQKRRNNDAIRLVGKAILKDIWRVQHGQEPVYGARTPWTPRPRYTDGTPKTPREPIQD